MRKLLSIIASILLINILFLTNVSAISITIDGKTSILTSNSQKENVETQEIFEFFAKMFPKTPNTYKYIQLNFKGIVKGTTLETSLKKLVYNDKIKNVSVNIPYKQPMNAYNFYKLSNLILGTDISSLKKDLFISRNANSSDLVLVRDSYILEQKKIKEEKNRIFKQNDLLENVYKTIKKEHYNKKNIKDEDLIYGAIRGLASGTGDKHTSYFPPTENKGFMESLNGNFEGIGAYVELKEPGKFMIVSPIPNSPAEKSGLKGGDRVIKVGEKEITDENSSEEIISWIKGPAGTTVKLTVLRDSKEVTIEITRAKIHLNNIDKEIKNSNTYYVKIKIFGEGVAGEFKEIIEEIRSDFAVKKIIIDLRNNGGGYLEEVTEMLSHLVEKGQKTAVVKYLNNKQEYTSKGYNTLDIGKYKVIILVNSGTASASEIMTGTLKDYFPNIQVIGEKTYGKGSVQTIKKYYDGSSFKYTIAKWFTGKTEKGIDGKGIIPDIELKFDREEFTNNGYDNQLEKALYQ